jgi:hypothetical protein
MTRRHKRLLLDSLERVSKTAVQAAAAAWLVAQDFTVTGLRVAGVAALVSVVTCIAGSQVGASDSASLLPADVDPPP